MFHPDLIDKMSELTARHSRESIETGVGIRGHCYWTKMAKMVNNTSEIDLSKFANPQKDPYLDAEVAHVQVSEFSVFDAKLCRETVRKLLSGNNIIDRMMGRSGTHEHTVWNFVHNAASKTQPKCDVVTLYYFRLLSSESKDILSTLTTCLPNSVATDFQSITSEAPSPSLSLRNKNVSLQEELKFLKSILVRYHGPLEVE